jgi:hypothetical protein
MESSSKRKFANFVESEYSEDKENLTEVFSTYDCVHAYTDGSCENNPGPGGWGALLLFKV